MFGLPVPAWAAQALAVALAAVALLLIGRHWGAAGVYEDWIAANETAAVASARIVRTQQVVTERVVVRWREREAARQVVTETIEREVTRYVESKPLTLACRLDDRWVQLHDAAAAGALPAAAGGTAARPGGAETPAARGQDGR